MSVPCVKGRWGHGRGDALNNLPAQSSRVDVVIPRTRTKLNIGRD